MILKLISYFFVNLLLPLSLTFLFALLLLETVTPNATIFLKSI